MIHVQQQAGYSRFAVQALMVVNTVPYEKLTWNAASDKRRHCFSRFIFWTDEKVVLMTKVFKAYMTEILTLVPLDSWIGVWIVTRPAGGGGGGAKGPPWDLLNYWTDFQISNAIR